MPYADYEEEILATVAALTGTVLADTPDPDEPGGYLPQTCWTALEAARISVVEYASDAARGRGRPMPPYVAVLIGDEAPSRGFGASERPQRAPVTVAILALETTHTQRQVRDLLRAVKAAWEAPDGLYDTFQAVETGRLDSSANNAVVRGLAIESKVRIVGATLAYAPGLLIIEPPEDE